MISTRPPPYESMSLTGVCKTIRANVKGLTILQYSHLGIIRNRIHTRVQENQKASCIQYAHCVPFIIICIAQKTGNTEEYTLPVYQIPSLFMTSGYFGYTYAILCTYSAWILICTTVFLFWAQCSPCTPRVLRFLGRSGEPHVVERGP